MKEKLRGGHLWVVVLGLLGFARGVDADRIAALVFWSDRDRFGGDVFIMQADGSGLRNLTSSLEPFAQAPAARLDGSMIAFVKGTIWGMDTDGGNLTQLVDHHSHRPSWSPDGVLLAFIANSWVGIDRDTWHQFQGMSGWGPYDVFILCLADGNITNLTQRPMAFPKIAWSPDGSRIAVQEAGPLGRYVGDLWVVEVNGGAIRQVTNGERVWSDISWSPDGTQIAYTAYSDDLGFRIWLTDLAGAVRRPLDLGPGFESASNPAWSPDGKTIAFLGVEPSVVGDLWLINVDGTEPRNLTNHPAHYSDITWIRGEGDTLVTPASWGIIKRQERGHGVTERDGRIAR